MRVFVTGGTGTVGSAVVAELLANGHTVLALARSARSAQALEGAGAETVRGGLADLDVLRASARQTDGVISMAFTSNTDAEAYTAFAAEESAAMAALGEELVGSDRPMLAASGTPRVAGRPATEADPLALDGLPGLRARSVNALLALAERGVRAGAVRLARTVHEHGEGGFAGVLTDTARRSGVAGYPGTGKQRWPAVHVRDAAVVFRLALETAPAGSTWHAVADEGVAVRDIATVIGRRLNLPVEAVPDDTFAPFGAIFATDQPASSARTQEALGWTPTHPGLLADLENLSL